ncbi:N-acetylneuraminate synthase family protein [Shewanella mesophila]|uniref:N-acetylneuraminate synthase family protein n=1 Tax=Shewanella mesophila TaxID=2864208 RepID=UPI001C655C53|nr:N-acetylneuraminate synthase family protein [Shewanella mesophila]QYJ85080.1 N-acetylneuraminate synthase family protein [Shewanella mesophila]
MSIKRQISSVIEIGKRVITRESSPYFIADIGANHNGDLQRAKELIYLAAEAGADAAKFQHFKADTIVSKVGFEALNGQSSHQAKWKKSVYEVYKDASISTDWTAELVAACQDAGVDFFTSPYSLDLVDYIDQYVSCYKVGSGDITWLEIIEYMAKKNKPMLLACGASSMDEVVAAVDAVLLHQGQLAIMQCNTNYTASIENFKYINLNVLKTLGAMYPDAILGLSDHTPGHATVLGAIALGANVIEKHFTDNNDLEGPDHKFAMNPSAWRTMVDVSQELHLALGNGIKKVEDNERETVVLQRRSIRLKHSLKQGHTIAAQDVEFLRPCPKDALAPYEVNLVIGKKLIQALPAGAHIKWNYLK